MTTIRLLNQKDNICYSMLTTRKKTCIINNSCHLIEEVILWQEKRNIPKKIY